MSDTVEHGSHREPQAPLTVRFPADDLEAMRRLAKRNHRSLNAEVVHAVADYIRRQHLEIESEQRP